MNSSQLSLLAVRIAGALALCSLLISSTSAGSNATGNGNPFVATTTNCTTQEVHAWTYPEGYLRGQDVICDLGSNEPQIQGKITLHQVCPVNGLVPCVAKFRIDADSGAQWEGSYWNESIGTNVELRGAGLGLGENADSLLVLDIRSLDTAWGWVGDLTSEGVAGRLIFAN